MAPRRSGAAGLSPDARRPDDPARSAGPEGRHRHLHDRILCRLGRAWDSPERLRGAGGEIRRSAPLAMSAPCKRLPSSFERRADTGLGCHNVTQGPVPMIRIARLAAASVALAGPAAAHDLWLSPGPGSVMVQYGHPHAPEMPAARKLASLIAYEPSRTVGLTAQEEAGSVPVLRATLNGDALVAAAYDNGYWVRLTDGSYRNASKRMARRASGRSSTPRPQLVRPRRGIGSSASRWRSSRWKRRMRPRARSGSVSCSRGARFPGPTSSPRTVRPSRARRIRLGPRRTPPAKRRSRCGWPARRC
jgi:hypothetical protein